MSEFDFLSSYIDNLPSSERKAYILNPGVDDTQIIEMERELGIVVPDELKAFYQFSYGAELDEYKILTIPEIVEHISQSRWAYEDSWRNSIIPFAYLVGVGDFIAFDLEQSNMEGLLILDCFHELSPEEWRSICYGLKNWMEAMAENHFRPFWLKKG